MQSYNRICVSNCEPDQPRKRTSGIRNLQNRGHVPYGFKRVGGPQSNEEDNNRLSRAESWGGWTSRVESGGGWTNDRE
jgi:hypothetical protein